MDQDQGKNLSKLPLAEWLRSFFGQPINVAQVVRYIEKQKEHHRRRTFQDEFRAFLKRYQVPYDEQYVWD